MFPPFSDRSIFLTNLYWNCILYIVQPIFIINPPHAEMMQLCKACKFRSKSKILPFFTPSLMNNATGIFVFTQRMQVVDMVRHTGSGATSWSTLATRGLRSLPYVPIRQMLKIPRTMKEFFFDRCAEEAGIVKKLQLVGGRWGVARIQPSQKIMIRIQPRPLPYVLTSVVGTIL